MHLIPKAHWCESSTGSHSMATPLPLSTAQHHVSLSNHDKQQLVDFVASHCSAPSDLTDQQVWALVQRQPVALPSIQASLDALATGRISHLLIENLPIDQALPAPPTDGVRPAGKGFVSEAVLLQLQLAAGLQPFGYLEEKAGALVHQIAPAQNRASELSSAGSVALGWHTDLGILKTEFRPEFLTLMGLRNEAATPTLIADLSEALVALGDTALVDVLRQPRYRVQSPASLVWCGGKAVLSEPRPLLANLEGFEMIAGNLQTVVPIDPAAQQALGALQTAVEAVAQPIVIHAGQALVFSNRGVLHGRPAIQRGQRWLQRVYSRHSLEPLREATATSPGAIIFSLAEIILQ
jgi:L-asparagine oxygenase